MSDDDFRYELLLPFLPVQSLDGPYEDCAYVAGWEMGMLDGELRMGGHREFAVTIRQENREQADLVAMRHGYAAEFKDYGDGWVALTARKSGEHSTYE
jgi:hypothetical protein